MVRTQCRKNVFKCGLNNVTNCGGSLVGGYHFKQRSEDVVGNP